MENTRNRSRNSFIYIDILMQLSFLFTSSDTQFEILWVSYNQVPKSDFTFKLMINNNNKEQQ